MADLQQLIDALRRRDPLARRALLATIVNAAGTARRALGGRVLVLPDGTTLATARCESLEAACRERAACLGPEPQPSLAALRLGASGAPDGAWIELLFEPVLPGTEPPLLRLAAECARTGDRGVLGTVFRIEGTPRVAVGDRFFVHARGSVASTLAGSPLLPAFLQDARQVLDEGHSDVLCFGVPGGAAEMLLEVVRSGAMEDDLLAPAATEEGPLSPTVTGE